MKIENVVKKFNNKLTYSCPKCRANSYIKEKSLVCDNNHTYDFSTKGYIHLISNYKATKYSEELFKAREIIFSNGFYNHIISALEEEITLLNSKNILDVGCGEGFYIKTLKNLFPDKYFFGLDNSKVAIELAVKNDKINPYLLANLANLPFADNSLDMILNILTPANYDEFSRVLSKEAFIIKILPTENYLKEIRDIFSNNNYSNDNTIELMEKYCHIVKRKVVTKDYTLDNKQAENFLKMTPLTFSKKITSEHIAKLKKIRIELEIIVAKVKKG